MFFPNHQGMYDVLAILDACPYPFSVVAKKEVKDVPFFKAGLFLYACIYDRPGRYQAVYAGDH